MCVVCLWSITQLSNVAGLLSLWSAAIASCTSTVFAHHARQRHLPLQGSPSRVMGARMLDSKHLHRPPHMLCVDTANMFSQCVNIDVRLKTMYYKNRTCNASFRCGMSLVSSWLHNWNAKCANWQIECWFSWYFCFSPVLQVGHLPPPPLF